MPEGTNSYRLRVYGVSDDWVETELTVLGGRCAVCRRTNPLRLPKRPRLNLLSGRAMQNRVRIRLRSLQMKSRTFSNG